MLGRVVVENGVKKIVPLTADCGSGNPVGTVIAVYSNKVPNGYLPCNGVAFDTAQFPVLYALLQDDHTPDLRECTLKGIGESGRTVGAHVKAGGLAVGEFVDDRIQNIKVDPDSESAGICAWTDGALIPANSPFTKTTPQTQWQPSSGAMGAFQSLGFDASKNVRAGATTEVKAVGVNWCIKATSGINENQADNVLSALSPVNAVTSGDMHAVTSNAVAQALTEKLNQGVEFGNDNSTSTITLGAGVYMFLSNFHPFVNQTGLYLVSIASRPDYNRVLTVDNNSTITLSVSSSSNVLTLTTTTLFRGLLVKVSDYTI